MILRHPSGRAVECDSTANHALTVDSPSDPDALDVVAVTDAVGSALTTRVRTLTRDRLVTVHIFRISDGTYLGDSNPVKPRGRRR